MSIDIAGELVLSSIVLFIFSPIVLPSTWRYCTRGHRLWLALCLLFFILAGVAWVDALRALLHLT